MIASLKLIRIIVGLVFAIELLNPLDGLAADSTATGTGSLKVTKESVLREGPAPYYKISENLASATIIQSLDKSGDWYLVKTPLGRIGWISAEDVTALTESENKSTATEPESTNEIEVIANGFLRTGPSNIETIIANLISGLSVKKITSHAEWYKIQLPDGLIGWADRGLFSASWEALPYTPPELRLTLNKNGNFRKNPNLKAPIIGTIANGTTVTILDSIANWYKIATDDNQIGWLNRILFETETGYSSRVSLLTKALQRNGNLRQTPTLKSPIITVVPAQTAVIVLDSLADWYLVRLPNQTTGWIHRLIFTK